VDTVHADKSSLQVSILAGAVPGNSGLSEAVEVRAADASTLFLFNVPENNQEADYYGVLAHSENKDINITGMYGFNELQEMSDVPWQRISLNKAGLDLSADIVKSSTVNIQSQKQQP
jgi:hypothetical protein